MLYVRQSLTPNEEILMEARFHWMYTLQACFWIVLGLGAGIALAAAAVWWGVASDIRHLYPTLPTHMFGTAWRSIILQRGGYVAVFWSLSPLIRFSMLGAFLMGIFFFAHMMIVRATTEIGVTTNRLIYKRGLIARQIGELNIDRIEGVSVEQGILGRIFGYGRVAVRGMGVGEVVLPPIEAPIDFGRAIHQAKAVHDKTNVIKPDDF